MMCSGEPASILGSPTPIARREDSFPGFVLESASMRLLFVIPHYFNVNASEDSQTELRGRHGSVSSPAELRVDAVRRTVMALHQTFGRSQAMIRHADRRTTLANEAVRHEVHVVIVTAGQEHLLRRADLPAGLYHQFSGRR